MTARNRAALKALFETGDTILQSSFEDLIDSFLDLSEVSSQVVSGPITIAGSATFSDTISVANGIIATNIRGTDITVSGNLIVTGTLSSRTSYNQVASAAARGTTRTSALDVSAYITILQTVSAGTNDGIRALGSNGVQYIINNTSATAKVYCADVVQPESSIDGTSVVSLLPNQRMTVYSLTGIIPTPFAVIQYTVVGAKASV